MYPNLVIAVLTFEHCLQNGHINILLSILAFPEDGQELLVSYNILDLKRKIIIIIYNSNKLICHNCI